MKEIILFYPLFYQIYDHKIYLYNKIIFVERISHMALKFSYKILFLEK